MYAHYDIEKATQFFFFLIFFFLKHFVALSTLAGPLFSVADTKTKKEKTKTRKNCSIVLAKHIINLLHKPILN